MSLKKKEKKVLEDDYSQKKAWFFLIAYFIFFTVIIVSLRTNSAKEEQGNKQKEFEFSFEKIESNNYKFNYELNLDNNKIIYDGKRNGQRSQFSMNNNYEVRNYFESGKLYLRHINDTWVKADSPFPISEILDINILKEILQKAIFESKTDYQDGSKTYTYKISTTTVEKLFYNEDIDIADTPNEISITFDSLKDVTKIEYDFTSYAKYKNVITTVYRFDMTFDDFSLVEELNI